MDATITRPIREQAKWLKSLAIAKRSSDPARLASAATIERWLRGGDVESLTLRGALYDVDGSLTFNVNWDALRM